MEKEPMLDGAQLDRLYEWGGEELKRKMIDLFFEHAPERLEGVRSGLEENDLELAERSAHSLKSSAANLGAEPLRALSGRIEEFLESGAEAEARRLFPEFETTFQETIDALETLLRQ